MLWFLLIGIISGWLAGRISHSRDFGIWGDLTVGIIGSFIGDLIFNLIGISAYGTIGSIILSTIGAVVLLWALRMFHVAEPAHKKE